MRGFIITAFTINLFSILFFTRLMAYRIHPTRHVLVELLFTLSLLIYFGALLFSPFEMNQITAMQYMDTWVYVFRQVLVCISLVALIFTSWKGS